MEPNTDTVVRIKRKFRTLTRVARVHYEPYAKTDPARGLRRTDENGAGVGAGNLLAAYTNIRYRTPFRGRRRPISGFRAKTSEMKLDERSNRREANTSETPDGENTKNRRGII